MKVQPFIAFMRSFINIICWFFYNSRCYLRHWWTQQQGSCSKYPSEFRHDHASMDNSAIHAGKSLQPCYMPSRGSDYGHNGSDFLDTCEAFDTKSKRFVLLHPCRGSHHCLCNSYSVNVNLLAAGRPCPG